MKKIYLCLSLSLSLSLTHTHTHTRNPPPHRIRWYKYIFPWHQDTDFIKDHSDDHTNNKQEGHEALNRSPELTDQRSNLSFQ